MVPLVGHSLVFGVRGVEQHVILRVGTAFLHFLDFLPDAVHGGHEVV